MATSSGAAEQLKECHVQLQALADGAHDVVTPAELQQLAEHAVACGVAELADEPMPEPMVELPTRPILAKDMLITVDLVQRALANNL